MFARLAWEWHFIHTSLQPWGLKCAMTWLRPHTQQAVGEWRLGARALFVSVWDGKWDSPSCGGGLSLPPSSGRGCPRAQHTHQIMDVPGHISHTTGHGCPRAQLTHARSCLCHHAVFFFLMQLKDRYFSNIRVLEITSILLFSLTKQNRQKNSVKKKKKKFSP